MKKRQYMVFNIDEVNLINFEEVLQTSVNTLRKSNDGTKSFVKWEEKQIVASGPSTFNLDENGMPDEILNPFSIDTELYIPESIKALTTGEGPYTHSEIINILSGSDWVAETANGI